LHAVDGTGYAPYDEGVRFHRVLVLLLAVGSPALALASGCDAFSAEEANAPAPDASSSDVGTVDAAADVGSPSTVKKVVAGSSHACALFGDGKLKCWGDNGFGALGLGDDAGRGQAPDTMGGRLPFVDVGSGRKVVDVLPLGNPTAKEDGGALQSITCALLDDGAVKCWGYNGYGTLGRGNALDLGAGPNQMGDDLQPISLGGRAVALTGGVFHACAMLEGGAVKCWGYNGYGNLGVGDVRARGGAPGDMGSALPTVPLAAPAVSVAAGGHHSCAILSDGRVSCWGYNFYGQLGLGDTRDRGGVADAGVLATVDLGGELATTIACGWYHTCAILASKKVKCWGYNGYGNLGLGDTVARGTGLTGGGMGAELPAVDLGAGGAPVAITAFDYATCVLRDDGTAKCFGYNADGQLGINDALNRGMRPNETGDNLPRVGLRSITQISMGFRAACALTDGVVKCWGTNAQGQLGQGDTVGRGAKPGDMGGLAPVDLGR